MKKKLEDVQGRVLHLLDTLKRVKGQARVRALQDLRHLVGSHSNARKALEENGGVALVFSLLGPFTSHAVGSEAVGIIVGLDLSYDQLKGSLMHPAKVSLLVDIMNEGTIETKMNCAKLIEMLLVEGNNEVLQSLSLLVGLLRLVRDKKHPTGVVSTGLVLLKAIVCSHESVRISVISLGGIPLLIELLPSLNNECLEVALYILEVLSTLEEGRMALKECPNVVPNVVKYLMRVSERCTQFALSILWAIYKLAPEECASQAVEAGLAAKLLLVIQSGCNPVLKQMSSEFLKLCSLNYSTSILISKCMLTSTIQ